MWQIICLVSGAEIQTHDLLIVSFLQKLQPKGGNMSFCKQIGYKKDYNGFDRLRSDQCYIKYLIFNGHLGTDDLLKIT